MSLNIIKKIQIYGDSIMKGVSLDEQSRKYFSSKEYVEKLGESHSLEITNMSKFGCTITKGYNIMQKRLEKPTDCEVVVLEYGGNDCDYNWEEVSKRPLEKHLPNTPISLFEETFKKMITLLKIKNIRPIIMNLPPIDAEKYFKWIVRNGLSENAIIKWLGDIQLIYRHQELYSSVAAKISKEMNCLFVDVRKYFLDKHNYKELICEDGIHPSAKGHLLIREAFEDFINSHLSRQELQLSTSL